MANTQQWFFLNANGQKTGPLNTQHLQQLVINGQIAANTQVWTEGLENWVSASHVEGLIPPQHQTVNPNPYSPPTSQPIATGITGASEYPVPKIKKTDSFIPFVILSILSILLILWGYHIYLPYIEEIHHTLEQQNIRLPIRLIEVGYHNTALIQIGFLGYIVTGVMRLIYVYRGWALFKPVDAATTPTKAVAFLFIPLFNVYWTFIAYWKWACEWNRITSSYSNTQNAPRASKGLFLTTIILGLITALIVNVIANYQLINLPLTPYSAIYTIIITYSVLLFFELLMIKQICNAINFMAAARKKQDQESS